MPKVFVRARVTGTRRGAPTTQRPRRPQRLSRRAATRPGGRRADMTGPAPGWASGRSRPDPDVAFGAVLLAAQSGGDSAVAVLFRRFNPALGPEPGAGGAAVCP